VDPALRESLYQFLAGRGGWQSPETRKWGMRRFEKMDEMGFQWQLFAQSLEDAEREADRFITFLRDAGAKPGAVRNYQKNLAALARYHKHRGFELAWQPEQRPKPSVYSRSELDRLHSLPYRKSNNRRLDRALALEHLAFGLRPGEATPMRDFDLDADASTFHVAFPEKGGPKRTLKVEEEVFLGNRALMAYLDHRESPRQAKNALWVVEDPDGSLHPLAKWAYQSRLSRLGRDVGVRCNATRGRHTRATAIIYNGGKLPYVAFWLGHTGPFTASHRYVELVDAGLAEHLQGSRWLRKSDRAPRGPPKEAPPDA
jgi:integrase